MDYSIEFAAIMAEGGSQPSKKRGTGDKEPTKVKITYPSNEEHWSRFLPEEHGQWVIFLIILARFFYL